MNNLDRRFLLWGLLPWSVVTLVSLFVPMLGPGLRAYGVALRFLGFCLAWLWVVMVVATTPRGLNDA
jgi:hypothetical protein